MKNFFEEAGVFENPSNLSSAIVVPTGKVEVDGDVATVEVVSISLLRST